jgi:hypothetical protein
MIEPVDPVTVFYRRQSMSDDQYGFRSVKRDDSAQHTPFCSCVERACRFIEDQNRRIVVECPCNSDSLPLSARQTNTSLTDHRLETSRQLGDEIL